jgi:hypothetical protein
MSKESYQTNFRTFSLAFGNRLQGIPCFHCGHCRVYAIYPTSQPYFYYTICGFCAHEPGILLLYPCCGLERLYEPKQ